MPTTNAERDATEFGAAYREYDAALVALDEATATVERAAHRLAAAAYDAYDITGSS